VAKDPAFLFYPGDWLGGTMLLNRHQKGCYIDLLMAQFNYGPLSLEQIKIVLGTDQASWTVLQEKFKRDANGRFFNEKLATEIEKRKKFVDSRSNNKSGRKKSYDKSYENHMNHHMENENVNRNSSFGKYENLFFDLSNSDLETSIEYLHRVAQKKFKPDEMVNYWQGFKIQYVNDFHLNRVEVIKHFRNWLRDQKNKENKISPGEVQISV
jgi:uncharacterized protein YdaU (DUF1376 family)